MMGKGSTRRPAQVDDKELKRRWEMAFRGKEGSTIVNDAFYGVEGYVRVDLVCPYQDRINTQPSDGSVVLRVKQYRGKVRQDV